MNDSFGLRTLNETGRVKVFEIPGVHHTQWHVNLSVFNCCIEPYLSDSYCVSGFLLLQVFSICVCLYCKYVANHVIKNFVLILMTTSCKMTNSEWASCSSAGCLPLQNYTPPGHSGLVQDFPQTICPRVFSQKGKGLVNCRVPPECK